MSDSPVISVVIPVYNAANTLAQCVGSVLEQDYSDIQVVLVDDGSTDCSGSMCDAFAQVDSRVTVLHQECIGVSSARNAGLDAALGRYTVFLDSDDYLLPGALKMALGAQQAHPEAWIIWHYTTGEEENLSPQPGMTMLDSSSLAKVYTDCLLSMPWNKLYLTKTAREVRFDEHYTLGEDLLFCLAYRRALRLNRFCILNAPLTFYRVGQSTGTLSTRYLPNYCTVWESIFVQLNHSMQECDCPQPDIEAVWRAELRVIAEGCADIMQRDPADLPTRKKKALSTLKTPWIDEHLERMRTAKVYSPYYRPVRTQNLKRVCKMMQSRLEETPYYGHMDWLGYYLLGGNWKR